MLWLPVCGRSLRCPGNKCPGFLTPVHMPHAGTVAPARSKRGEPAPLGAPVRVGLRCLRSPGQTWLATEAAGSSEKGSGWERSPGNLRRDPHYVSTLGCAGAQQDPAEPGESDPGSCGQGPSRAPGALGGVCAPSGQSGGPVAGGDWKASLERQDHTSPGASTQSTHLRKRWLIHQRPPAPWNETQLLSEGDNKARHSVKIAS